MYNLNKFKEGLVELDISLNDIQIEQFLEYYELLNEWNKVMNLTSIIEFDDVIEKHFLDSLSLVKVLNMNDIKNVIDIGTGAGFPGIPLKIVFPHLEVTLLDSVNKKINFLKEVTNKLGLIKIESVHFRAEEYARKFDIRESFDLCVSRAVANLASLSEYCIPFVKKGGCFISYKSGEIEDELSQSKKAIYVLGGEVIDVNKFELPGTTIQRSFVCIKKIRNTAKLYPRKAGLPLKNPIS